jgi:hypothetical protein
MTRSTWRSQRVPTTALLVLALAITTGWTPAAAPVAPDEAVSQVTTLAPAIGLGPVAATTPQISASLATHRAFQATQAMAARTLFQARTFAARAIVPAQTPAVIAPVRVKAPAVKSEPRTYAGTNHFWFPALKISRPVYLFACTRKREPDNYVYRWGCAGSNNVYLLGHAWGVFKPLHDAYLAGRLKVGMVAYYADGNGRVRKYKVTTWRVVNPVDSHWAIASQPVPSMTLQTCIGLDRLNVRLVAVN